MRPPYPRTPNSTRRIDAHPADPQVEAQPQRARNAVLFMTSVRIRSTHARKRLRALSEAALSVACLTIRDARMQTRQDAVPPRETLINHSGRGEPSRASGSSKLVCPRQWAHSLFAPICPARLRLGSKALISVSLEPLPASHPIMHTHPCAEAPSSVALLPLSAFPHLLPFLYARASAEALPPLLPLRPLHTPQLPQIHARGSAGTSLMFLSPFLVPMSLLERLQIAAAQARSSRQGRSHPARLRVRAPLRRAATRGAACESLNAPHPRPGLRPRSVPRRPGSALWLQQPAHGAP